MTDRRLVTLTLIERHHPGDHDPQIDVEIAGDLNGLSFDDRLRVALGLDRMAQVIRNQTPMGQIRNAELTPEQAERLTQAAQTTFGGPR